MLVFKSKVVFRLAIFMISLRGLLSLKRQTTKGMKCRPVNQNNVCFKGWTPVSLSSNSKQYYGCFYFDMKLMTYSEARSYCKSHAADLLIGDVEGTTQAVLGHVWKRGAYRPTSVWLGLNDVLSIGSWTWVTPEQSRSDTSLESAKLSTLSQLPNTLPKTKEKAKQAKGKKSRQHAKQVQERIKFDPDLDTGYRNWKGRTRPRSYKKCATFVPFERYWLAIHCSRKTYRMCHTTISGNKTCPNYYTEIYKNECFKLTTTRNYTWTHSDYVCAENNASLLHISNVKIGDAVFEYLERNYSVWLGLTDAKREGTWTWLSGRPTYRLEYSNWGDGQPKMDLNQNCAIVSSGMKWYARDCLGKAIPVCMRGGRVGPGKTRLVAKYHRPDGIFYQDEPAEISCTAIGAVDNEINWKAYVQGQSFNIHAGTTQLRPIKLSDGICIKRVKSVVKMNAEARYHKAEVMCFAMAPSRHCPKQSRYWQTCDVITMNVLDGPKGSPYLTVNYTGPPSSILRGERVFVECTVHTGPHGTLMWVLTKNKKLFPLKNDDENIIVYDRSNTSSGRLFSRLGFTMRYKFISIACFSYDVVKYGANLSCLETDRYCKSTETMSVRETEKIPTDMLWLLLIPVAMLVLLILFIMTVSTNRKRSKKQNVIVDDKDSSKLAEDQETSILDNEDEVVSVAINIDNMLVDNMSDITADGVKSKTISFIGNIMGAKSPMAGSVVSNVSSFKSKDLSKSGDGGSRVAE